MQYLNEADSGRRGVEILLVDDSPADLELMERELEDSGLALNVRKAQGMVEMESLMKEALPDLIVTDYVLPDGDGLAVLAMVRECQASIPVIVITGAVDERTASACILAGAADYVLKDHLPRLSIAVMNALEKARSVAEILEAQEALRQSEDRFRNVAESAGDGILIADCRGRIQMFNRSALEMFGYEEAEILGQGIEILMVPELRERHRMAVTRAIQEAGGVREPRPREYLGVRKDGSRFPLELTVSSWTDGEGTHLSGIIRNITRRKADEDRLRESEERYRRLVESLPVVTFAMALEPRPHLTFVSSRVEAILGIPSDQWTGDASFLESRIHPQDQRRALREIVQARKTGRLEDLTIRLQGALGRTHWVRINASFLERNGGPPKLQGILRDITDLKEMELERDLLAAAVEQSDSLVLITDLEGRTLYANPAFEARTGYSREEVMGRNPRVLLGGTERLEEDRKMWEALGKGEMWGGEFENRKKDGTRFITRASVSPIHDDRGKVTHVVGISQDITAEKEMEAELRQMQKMETVGQLTGGIAHDMNNILAAILSYTTLARADLDSTQTRIGEDLAEVETAAQRGAELIRKLMSFSRRDHLRPRCLNVKEVVAGLEGMLTRILPATLKVFHTTRDEDLWCRADQGALEQILVNLATNARDAITGPGEIHIQADRTEVHAIPPGALHQPRPGPFIRIQMRDTGCGMSDEVRRRLFEPFFTTKPLGKGTGLGMAVIHGLVGQHGGFLTVESEVGTGTTVTVYIPPAEAQEPEISTSLPCGGKDENETGGRRILVADDDPHIRKTVERLLLRAGYGVSTVSDGAQALEVLKGEAGAIDLVVTDLMLPGLTGAEVYRRLNGNGRRPRFLFTTGYAQEDTELDKPDLRDIPFLQKPWEPQEFLAMVRSALSSALSGGADLPGESMKGKGWTGP